MPNAARRSTANVRTTDKLDRLRTRKEAAERRAVALAAEMEMAAIPEKERYVILPAGPRKDYGGAETRALNLASPHRPEGEQGPLVLTDAIRLDYAAQCVTHTQFFRADSYSAARRYARHPYLFCAGCQDALISTGA